MTQRTHAFTDYLSLALLVLVGIVFAVVIVLVYSVLGCLVSLWSLVDRRVRFRWPHRAAVDVFMKSAGVYIGKKLGEEVLTRD